MANNSDNLTYECHSGRDGVNLYKQTLNPEDQSILAVIASTRTESVDRTQFDIIRASLIQALTHEILGNNIKGYSPQDLGLRQITLEDGTVVEALISEIINEEARSHQKALNRLRDILKGLKG